MRSFTGKTMKYFLFTVFLLSFNLNAQYLNIDSSLKSGSGLRARTLNGKVGYQRSPFYLMIDNSFITDGDFGFQYGFGIDLTLEKSITLTPSLFLKLEKNLFNNILIFGLIGVSYMIIPDTVFGLRLGLGGSYKFSKDFAFVFEADLEPFLFGSWLHDYVITDINFLFGVSYLF